MSAGKPVVAVRLPEIERLHELITLTSTREEFVEGIRRGIAEKDPVLRERRIAYARDNGWERRAAQLHAAAGTHFPKVSIIVLCYNQRSFTKTCLDSIERFTRYANMETVVVNNGSTDGTEKFLARWSSTRPWARVVTNGSNLGFAAGNNRGARAATGEYLIFLNNDTFVTDGWVGDLLAHFRRHPELGLLGPITNRSGNESVIRIQVLKHGTDGCKCAELYCRSPEKTDKAARAALVLRHDSSCCLGAGWRTGRGFWDRNVRGRRLHLPCARGGV